MIIRAFAVLQVVSMVLLLPGIVVQIRETAAAGGNPWLFAIPIGVALLMVAALWLFADKLARLALTRPQDHVFESDLDASTWFGLILAGIGAWYFFGGLLDGVRLGAQAFFYANYRPEGTPLDLPPDFWMAVITALVQLVLGVALTLRGRGLAALLWRLRYAGMRADGDGSRE
ncbi:hypothetical protein [Luteimonas aquatica]|uniref:hypothetical protein n=1 Tax=Luteimonas aquatica TaxID=450364 RepID=UPI001F589925|nr:hypothetical protein [Luteimonas aquatica]